MSDPRINGYIGLTLYNDAINEADRITGVNSIKHRFAYYNGGPRALEISRDCESGYLGKQIWYAYECPFDDTEHTVENLGYEQTRTGSQRMLDIHNALTN